MDYLSEGVSYKITTPAYTDEVMQIPEHSRSVLILKKPDKVECDGKVEDLPEHLSSDKWYFVENISTGSRHFMYYPINGSFASVLSKEEF